MIKHSKHGAIPAEEREASGAGRRWLGEEIIVPIPEIAARLGVCTRTIRRWLRAGTIPSVRIDPNKEDTVESTDPRAKYMVRETTIQKIINPSEKEERHAST